MGCPIFPELPTPLVLFCPILLDPPNPPKNRTSLMDVPLNKLRPNKGFDPVVITLVICRFDPERLKPFSLPMQCTKVCTKIFPNNLASGSKINKTNPKTAIQMLILICYISPSKIVLHT